MPALRSAVIRFRIEPDLKQLFKESAAALGYRQEAGLMRRLVLDHLQAQARLPTPQRAAPTSEAETQFIRRTVNFPVFLLQAMVTRGKLLNMTGTQWLHAVAQSNLAKDPVLTTPELYALRDTARELAAIGRNVNQLAKAANSAALKHDLPPPVDLVIVAEVLPLIKETRARVRSLVRASQRVWDVTIPSERHVAD